jgi:hypothetical protein
MAWSPPARQCRSWLVEQAGDYATIQFHHPRDGTMADSSNGSGPEVLRWVASVITMGAGLVLAARVRPRLTGWAFVVLTLASLIWIGIGYLSGEYALRKR